MPTSIALTPHFEALAKQLVESGNYNNVSEVVRSGLRMLESSLQQDQAKLAALRDAAKLGFDAIENGDSLAFSTDQSITEFVQRAGAKAKAATSNLKTAA